MRFFTALLMIVGIACLAWVIVPKIRQLSWFSPQATATPTPAFTDRPSASNLQITARITDGDVSRAVSCQAGVCRPTIYPREVVGAAVSDGQSWYYYNQEKGEGKNEWKTKLVRLADKGGKPELITESTPLTEPRGLFISPDNTKVAFFLDNVDDRSKQLTELWVYDVANKGIRLIAEKLYRPDIRSKIYWNTASTYVWFIGDTGERTDPEDKLAVILVSAQSPGMKADFAAVDWQELLDNEDKMRADVAPNGSSLAAVRRGFFGQNILSIIRSGREQITGIRGDIIFLQWLDDHQLLYAVQDRTGFTFWVNENGTNRFVARRNGTLGSAFGLSDGSYVTFSVWGDVGVTKLYSLHILTGAVIDEGKLVASLQSVSIANVAPFSANESEDQPGSIAAVYDDSELASFVERNLTTITGNALSQPERLITTDKDNMVYIDYRQSTGNEERLLIKVHDAVNTDWSIRARYRPVNGEWKKTQGGGMADPAPRKLYEWEDSVKRWIQKENYESSPTPAATVAK